MAVSAGASTVASTSMGTGFYGAGFMNTTSTGIKNTIDTSLSVGSTFVAGQNIDIASNRDINTIGSMLSSYNGNINLSAANNINIEAGTNTICNAPIF